MITQVSDPGKLVFKVDQLLRYDQESVENIEQANKLKFKARYKYSYCYINDKEVYRFDTVLKKMLNRFLRGLCNLINKIDLAVESTSSIY